MGEIIVVTSGKGGVGKTTTTANIGAGLSRLGKKVLVIDTDLGLRNLDVVMGLENRIVYNLVDVIEGGCRLKQAMISDKRHENLYLLPSAQLIPSSLERVFIELRTRHAPVPQERSIMPHLPTTEAFSISPALVIGMVSSLFSA